LSHLQALQGTDPSLSMFTVRMRTFAVIVTPFVSVLDPRMHRKHW